MNADYYTKERERLEKALAVLNNGLTSLNDWNDDFPFGEISDFGAFDSLTLGDFRIVVWAINAHGLVDVLKKREREEREREAATAPTRGRA